MLLKSIWLRQPKNYSQKNSLIRVKELFLDACGKDISYAKYQQVSEELEDVVTVILNFFLFLKAYFREKEIIYFYIISVYICMLR